jgi:hypothetical protein
VLTLDQGSSPGSTLIEQVTFDRSHVTSLDWESHPIITFPDVPEGVMDLIDRPDKEPWGAGEPSALRGAGRAFERGVRRDGG